MTAPPPLEYEAQAGRAPGALVAVAWIFIAAGVLALLDMILKLFQYEINLNFGVLGIFVGRGLLHFSRGWRTCGLVLIWIVLIATPLLAVFAVIAGSVHFGGAQLTGIPRVLLAVILCGIPFAIAVWIYRVLTRPDVRQLFRIAPTASDSIEN